MSSWVAENRRREEAQRRIEREEKKTQRELERRRKEQAKLSTLEQARLEVDSFENELDVLLSVHKSHGEDIDWRAIASGLPAYGPLKLARHELEELLRAMGNAASCRPEIESAAVEEARLVDEQEYQTAVAAHASDSVEWAKEHALARRVLAGEPRAYVEAISTRSGLGEVLNLGSSLHFTVHDAKLVECDLNVNGQDVIPSSVKSLTASGKLAVKAMPKARFHELYQDYVCSCVLRVARELFALLPIELALITATVDGIDPATGNATKLPVLSLAAPRLVIGTLQFQKIDPSDSLANFQHRGDVMTSRRSGSFIPIQPLTPADLISLPSEKLNFGALAARVATVRSELHSLATGLGSGRDDRAAI